jgi:hypothetical protein
MTDFRRPKPSAETVVSSCASTQLRRLQAVRDRLARRLRRDDPDEWVWWWIAEDAFEIPPHGISVLQRAGPPLAAFFAAANSMFYRDPGIQRRLEKRLVPAYAILNRAQPASLPLLVRPDVVLDQQWSPKFVELEITVCARYELVAMADHYGLDPAKSMLRAYVDLVNRRWPGKNVALLAAPCPSWRDVGDEACEFAEVLRRAGLDVVVITEENIAHLRFDGRELKLCRHAGAPVPIHVIDRYMDIYEIAELRHPGISAVLDAYAAGAVEDMNTCKQFLDEKAWMALFWEPEFERAWRAELGDEQFAFLRGVLPKSWVVGPDTVVECPDGAQLPIRQLCDEPAEHRMFVLKESGTSETASGARSLRPLHELGAAEARAALDAALASSVPYVIQETVESPTMSFTALDTNTESVVTQRGARIKLSVFYVDGAMTDIKLIASNAQFAVNDGRCVEGVVRY